MLVQKTQSLTCKRSGDKKKRPFLHAGFEEGGGRWLFYPCERCDSLHYLPREEQQGKDSTALWPAHGHTQMHTYAQVESHTHTQEDAMWWVTGLDSFLITACWKLNVTRSVSAVFWAEEINSERSYKVLSAALGYRASNIYMCYCEVLQ